MTILVLLLLSLIVSSFQILSAESAAFTSKNNAFKTNRNNRNSLFGVPSQDPVVTSRRTTSSLWATTTTTTNTPVLMKGSGNDPVRNKKKIAVVGCGGYTGALIFGFLQRCTALSYQTGITNPRAIGATADTAIRLNRMLSRHFCLAYADESYIKLTDLSSVESMQQRLSGYDAIIFGLDNLFIQSRTVTGGSYEKSPNEKTWEIYWGSPQGSFYVSDDEQTVTQQIQSNIISNIIDGAKAAGIQHAFVVYGDNNDSSDESAIENDNGYRKLIESKIPYTVIRTSAQSYVKSTSNYTFKSGIQTPNLSITTSSSSTLSSLQPICLEDLAAVCVQCIQSIDWSTSRTVFVSGEDDTTSKQPTVSNIRTDQQWCVNSFILRDKLATI